MAAAAATARTMAMAMAPVVVLAALLCSLSLAAGGGGDEVSSYVVYLGQHAHGAALGTHGAEELLALERGAAEKHYDLLAGVAFGGEYGRAGAAIATIFCFHFQLYICSIRLVDR
jgi:hypothetical protein